MEAQPSTDLVTTPTPIETELDLRVNITTAEARLAKLVALFELRPQLELELEDEFRSELEEIRVARGHEFERDNTAERESCEKWIVGADEAEIATPLTTEKKRVELSAEDKRRVHKLIVATNQEKDSDGSQRALFDLTLRAKNTGDTALLRALENIYDAGEQDILTRYASLDRAALEEKVTELNENVRKMLDAFSEVTILGVGIRTFISDECELDREGLSRAVGVKISSVQHDLQTTTREPDASPGTTSISRSLVESSTPHVTPLSTSDATLRLDTVLAKAQQVAQLIATRTNGLAVFNSGNSPVVRVYSDDSMVATQLEFESFMDLDEFDAGGVQAGRVEDRADYLALSFNRRHVLQLDLREGKNLQLYKPDESRFSQAYNDLDRMERILGRPTCKLLVTYRGAYRPVLGGLDGERELEENTSYEALLAARLMRSIYLLKVPRLRFWNNSVTQNVFIAEDFESFPYDGRHGVVRAGQQVTWQTGSAEEGNLRVRSGEIHSDVDTEQEDLFPRLIGSRWASATGTLAFRDDQLPFSVTTDGATVYSFLAAQPSGIASSMKVQVGNRAFSLEQSMQHGVKLQGISPDELRGFMHLVVEGLAVEEVSMGSFAGDAVQYWKKNSQNTP